MTFKLVDKDNGFKELVENIEQLTKPRAVLVGITEDSPRAQFRLGTSQEFRPETAGLLIRKPVDAKTNEIKQRLTEIGRKVFATMTSPNEELLALGEEIKADMGAQTDPPPQLRNAIIVKLADDT